MKIALYLKKVPESDEMIYAVYKNNSSTFKIDCKKEYYKWLCNNKKFQRLTRDMLLVELVSY